MFLSLNDGRKELYQWDIGRKARVSVDCDEVHFAHLNYADSLPVKVVDGEVEIPNQLLTVAMPLLCWAFVKDADGHYTKQTQTIEVLRRAKPSDYLYTETEVISVKDAVNQGLEEAKASGEFDGEKGDKGDKGDKGEDGKSAYEIAVESGKFEGTEEEWLEYLEGAQSQKVNEALQGALNGIAGATAGAHEGIESHLGYALSEISSARDQSMEEIHNAKQEAINEISENIVQTTGTDETVVMSQKASSNAFTNALKGTVSGEAIAITDVSPIEHEMGVKVRSKNLWDEVWRTGVVLANGTFQYNQTNNIMSVNAIPVKANVRLRVVCPQMIRAVLYDANDVRYTTTYPDTGGTITPTQDGYLRISLGASVGTDSPAVTEYGNNICIFIDDGTTATAYTPYIEDISTVKVIVSDGDTVSRQYNVNADGTVDGVTSIYPNMTLNTDTAGAIIDCTYNRDINKAFAELQSIVNTLVGG